MQKELWENQTYINDLTQIHTTHTSYHHCHI